MFAALATERYQYETLYILWVRRDGNGAVGMGEVARTRWSPILGTGFTKVLVKGPPNERVKSPAMCEKP